MDKAGQRVFKLHQRSPRSPRTQGVTISVRYKVQSSSLNHYLPLSGLFRLSLSILSIYVLLSIPSFFISNVHNHIEFYSGCIVYRVSLTLSLVLENGKEFVKRICLLRDKKISVYYYSASIINCTFLLLFVTHIQSSQTYS